MFSHVAASTVGNVARFFQADFGVSADGEAVFLAMQPILQALEFGRGFADLARRPYLQVEARNYAIGVFAGFDRRADQGIAEFSFENSDIIWGGILFKESKFPPMSRGFIGFRQAAVD